MQVRCLGHHGGVVGLDWRAQERTHAQPVCTAPQPAPVFSTVPPVRSAVHTRLLCCSQCLPCALLCTPASSAAPSASRALSCPHSLPLPLLVQS